MHSRPGGHDGNCMPEVCVGSQICCLPSMSGAATAQSDRLLARTCRLSECVATRGYQVVRKSSKATARIFLHSLTHIHWMGPHSLTNNRTAFRCTPRGTTPMHDWSGKWDVGARSRPSRWSRSVRTSPAMSTYTLQSAITEFWRSVW